MHFGDSIFPDNHPKLEILLPNSPGRFVRKTELMQRISESADFGSESLVFFSEKIWWVYCLGRILREIAVERWWWAGFDSAQPAGAKDSASGLGWSDKI